jgi:hypothetical protein
MYQRGKNPVLKKFEVAKTIGGAVIPASISVKDRPYGLLTRVPGGTILMFNRNVARDACG